MSGEVDALYIYDENNSPLVEHVYRSRPPSAASTLPLFLAHPAPRPSLVFLPNLSPPVTVFSILHANLLFLALSEVDSEPLLVLEFLHRVVDVLEAFVGAPLLSTKLQAHYDVVAQLLNEMCDAGIVCNTEPNALEEVVQKPGWMGKFLGGLSGSSTPSLGQPNSLKQALSAGAAQGPAIPWRRSNVRHTSNELYVDIVESLSVTIAPSGRVLAALVSGTIAFTAEISGVPELVLSLSTAAGQQAIAQKVQLPVFHPCVRLAKWRERPGELCFIPPDGRFILAGYEVDLLPTDPDLDQPPSHMEKIFLPAIVDIHKSLGPTGSDFEVRLTLNTNFPGFPSPARYGAGRGGPGTSTPSFLGGSGASGPAPPVLEEVTVTVPISKGVRNIVGMQASRGDAQFSPGSDVLKWVVPTKDVGSVPGTATLRCTITGQQPMDEDVADDLLDDAEANHNLLQGYYDEPTSTPYPNPVTAGATTRSTNTGADADTGTGTGTTKRKTKKKKVKKSRPTLKHEPTTTTTTTTTQPSSPSSSLPQPQPEPQPQPDLLTSPQEQQPQQPEQQQQQSSPPPPQKIKKPKQKPKQTSIFHPPPSKTKPERNASLMPNSASVSFSVRGWLPSGIRVDSLNIDPRRSRGLGEGVRPYKGVKYVCVSRRGVERRC